MRPTISSADGAGGSDTPSRERETETAPKPSDLRALPPERSQHPLERLRLATPRRKRRDLPLRLAAVPAAILHIGQDLAPPRRERIAQLTAQARDIEARNPARHRRHDRIPARDQVARQPVPVVRPDQARVAVKRNGIHAPPPPVGVPRHVGDHGMGVELRIEVAAGHVAERRRRHEGRLHPGTPPRLRVPAARLQKGLLHPVQRRPDRLVMRPHHRTVAPGMALRRQQRRQRYGLRRRKGQVESRTALVPAVPDPPQPDLRPRHMTLQQPLERPRRHPRARLQTQRLRPTPVPRARLAVLLPLRVKRSRVALRPDVIPPVVPEILQGGRRRGQIADRRYHRNEP